jgi:hypothetical protein
MRTFVLLSFCVLGLAWGGQALAAGPSGSSECHIQDDDCDGLIDEDTGSAADDNDGDGRIDEDSAGDTNGDGNADDDLDGLVDEDAADDDGDGSVDEDPVGDAADDAGENQVDCNEDTSEDVAGAQLYVAENGAELCNEGGFAAPIVEGRIVATTDDGGYLAIDGDGSNTAPADGYIRLDQGGVYCGDATANQDSGADQTGNTQEDCG